MRSTAFSPLDYRHKKYYNNKDENLERGAFDDRIAFPRGEF